MDKKDYASKIHGRLEDDQSYKLILCQFVIDGDQSSQKAFEIPMKTKDISSGQFELFEPIGFGNDTFMYNHRYTNRIHH